MDSNLSDQLQQFKNERNGCELLLNQPKLVDRFFSDSEMNNITLLLQFFRFLLHSIDTSKRDATKLVLRLPGSNILGFAYDHLNPTMLKNQKHKIFDDFASILSKILQTLLELHPHCWEQIESLGLFDRLDIFSQKYSNKDLRMEISTLISQVDNLRKQHEEKQQKFKSKFEIAAEQDEPPPDDFHQLSIYPTLDEIFQQQIPYLRKNLTKGGYDNGTQYLDIHFRLLREDFLQPLRQAICQYMNDDNRNVTFRNENVRLYRNVILSSSVCSNVGILFSLALDMQSLSKSINWSNSRRLIFGNLLAATFDDFATSCFLVTVEDRSDIENNGTISVRCQKELCDYKLMRIPPGTKFTLLETTSYFEAYRPILQALQNITNDRLPLEEYLLHCNKDVRLPNYFQTRSTIDFQPILIKNTVDCDQFKGDICNINDISTWPSAKQFGLDNSQYEALKLALTKAVALIQGPPGCGKTFLGVRLAELFYHNRHRIDGCNRPILMICYTNHALDQFLSSIIRKLSLQPGEVVRVGGRSKHSDIEPFLIQKLRHQRRDNRPKDEELYKKYDILRNLKKQIDDCNSEYYSCSHKLLGPNQLLRVLTRKQFLTFIDPILSNLEIFSNHWNLMKGEVYCCREEESDDSDSDSTDIEEEDDDDQDEDLSFYGTDALMKNRIYCHKLNTLSENDVNEINKLLIKWLDATKLQTIIDEMRVQDDDEGEFREQGRQKKKNKDKTSSILKEMLNDTILTTTKSNDTKTDIDNKDNLEDDEEELRRLENIDNSYTPFSIANINKEKEKKQVNVEQLERMQRLTNKRIVLSDEIKNINDLWSNSIDKNQRQTLYRYWLYEYIRILRDEWFNLNDQYDENYRSMQQLWLSNDQLYMKNAFIIAMTTHCASRYQRVLKEIAPRICIVEEAAEVFESHIVTAIGEGIEHLILIGDHIQLRPSPNVYTLAKYFNLDVSLFERLIKNQMPSVQLCVQHRSIPMISSLTHHFYSTTILNDSSVLNRPSIIGVKHPLYFINHQKLEEDVADGASKRNHYECMYIVHLAHYLINQGYEKSDITILTTYMGQRQLIQNNINQSKELRGISVTVVDNFQGEENKIILLSLVRSNREQRLGYIAVDNRICVALSRAQNGFYVIGNFQLLAEQNKTWSIIINKIKDLSLFGSGLPIHCAQHPNDEIICFDRNDFLRRPLGGCGLKCETRLSCGHQCPLSCHNTPHDKIDCQKPCLKSYDDCEHQCQRKCHSTSECLPCSETIKLKMPNCQHTSDIACFMRKTNCLECGVLVPYKCRLGHDVQVRCCDLRNKELNDQLCTHPCNFPLKCGHSCKGTCSTCVGGRFHHPCDQRECVIYICGHSQERRCHEVGPRCEKPSIKLCDHPDEPDTNNGRKFCTIHYCGRFCQNRCKHSKCTQRCRVECDRLPCDTKCSRRFDCEHYCNAVCGEPCIDCLLCRDKDSSNEIRKVTRGHNLRHAMFVKLECGHIFTPDVLDKHVEDFKNSHFLSNGFFIVSYPRCPTCQRSLVECKRYSSLMKKIHYEVYDFSLRISLNGFENFFPTPLTRLVDDTKLPESITKIVKQNEQNARRENLTKLFLRMIIIFQQLSDRIDIERNRLFKALYKSVEENNSIFLTNQQWLDLESEYNRLRLIDVFREKQESLKCDLKDPEIFALNDILFASDPFNEIAYEVCNSLFTYDTKTEKYQWQSVLPNGITWEQFELEQCICNGKLAVCPTGNHMIRTKAVNEQSKCLSCEETVDVQPTTGLGRGRSRNWRSQNKNS